MRPRIVDCHAHLIDPVLYPLARGGRGYVPKAGEYGTCDQYCDTLDRHGVDNALLVQLSGYGTDNSILLDAMQARPGRFKTIAVVESDIPESELEKLASAGVVGVRFNLVSYDADHLFRPDTLRLLACIKSLGWFAQVFADNVQWTDAAARLRASGVRVLIDHFGVRTPAAMNDAGFAAVMDLARDGIATIKLSAPFRISKTRPTYDDLDPVVETLLSKVGTNSLIWGSDWPFPDVSPRLSYADAMSPLSRWLTSADDRERVLWRNPARLFGFSGNAT